MESYLAVGKLFVRNQLVASNVEFRIVEVPPVLKDERAKWHGSCRLKKVDYDLFSVPVRIELEDGRSGNVIFTDDGVHVKQFEGNGTLK